MKGRISQEICQSPKKQWKRKTSISEFAHSFNSAPIFYIVRTKNMQHEAGNTPIFDQTYWQKSDVWEDSAM